jgi:hypothetical protein
MTSLVGEEAAVRPFRIDVPEDPRPRPPPRHGTGSARDSRAVSRPDRRPERARRGPGGRLYQAAPANGGHFSFLHESPSSPVKGDPHELILRPTVHPGRPRLRLRRAEPPIRVHRHVHEPVHRHRGSAPARGHRR